MSIIDSFDPESGELFTASQVYDPEPGFPETMVICFTRTLTNIILERFGGAEFSRLHCGLIDIVVNVLEYKGHRLGFATTMLGASAAAAVMEELIAKGARNFLYFGSCGTLYGSLQPGYVLVPTAAYRDEGTSYHYAPASDYIDIPSAKRLAEVLTELNIPHTLGRVWTTDALYRETKRNVQLRKADGCLAVDMECAALTALSAYRNVNHSQFLFTEDSLDGGEWDMRIMGKWTQDHRERLARIALEAAIRMYP